ncbi:alpha/beta hydrolase [Malacoplasma iowae]|uniref:Alpha/beta hydrolase family protein n=2 Tax=Malacoplasma iowae TaxID=2116 RepID=A0A084U3Q1_MALIO|nr:alpha/beta hydrolase [Malacoplasma iowae]VEU62928.1 esterase/lipase [Mycoplasmopsis fermentans]EGZ31733.1 lipase-esterase related protein [Malacoplasma iowae 695]KFB07587.1 alpha/beta hydrolase family protein [Malacoplasma iowae DK-CPA]QHG89453.1 alpha/beta hydrolase [Malacoplasma iowae 695]WPL35826.1 alpha/beta hydrolase [Malacoplasma iowae]
MLKATSANCTYHYQKAKNVSKGNIVFIHGYATTSMYHQDAALEFSDYNYYAIELPGHGYTDVRQNLEFSPINIAIQVVDWIHSLNLDEIILIGHSMGGGIAEMINLYIPQKISKIILVSPMNSSIDLSGLFKKKKLSFKNVKDLTDWHKIIFKNPDRLNLNNSDNENKLESELDYQTKNKDNFKILKKNIYSLKNLKNLKFAERKNDKPTLLIASEFDQVIKLKNLMKVFSKKENVIISVFKDSGHIPFMEEKELYVKTIKEFIESK